MIFQLNFVFTLNAAVEKLEKRIDLALIQGRVKRDFGKFKVCASPERGPWFFGVPRSWASTLWTVFAVILKFNDLWGQFRVGMVFSSNSVKWYLFNRLRNRDRLRGRFTQRSRAYKDRSEDRNSEVRFEILPATNTWRVEASGFSSA